MTTTSTAHASATQPHRTGLRPTSGRCAAWLACALVALVTMLALPREAAAKYGSPLVAHVATASGRGGVYLAAHRDPAPVVRRAQHLRPDRATPRQTERRASERLASHSDLGNGIVLARSARPTPQLAVVQSALALIERNARIDAAGAARFDEGQCAAGQAHRLRGPPALGA
jgi:hypothetical protein